MTERAEVLTRPRTHEEAQSFSREMGAALSRLGVQRGDEFIITTASLADSAPRARRSDPSTSSKAAAETEPRVGSQRHIVLKALLGSSGLTAREINERVKFEAWRRVSEVLRQGYIEPTGEERRSDETGRAGEVYRLTARGEALARREA